LQIVAVQRLAKQRGGLAAILPCGLAQHGRCGERELRGERRGKAGGRCESGGRLVFSGVYRLVAQAVLPRFKSPAFSVRKAPISMAGFD
jgi:hypothetical protein